MENIIWIDIEKANLVIYAGNILLGFGALIFLSKFSLKKNLLIWLSEEIKDYKHRIKKLDDTKNHLKLKKENRIILNHTKEIDKLIKSTKKEFQDGKINEIYRVYNNGLKEKIKKEKIVTLFESDYPIESLVERFLPNFRRYWFCIIVLYSFLAIQLFCFDKKHEKEIHLNAKITAYVNSKSKKRVEWKKEYKDKIIELDTININSLKAKSGIEVNIASFINKRLTLLTIDSIINPSFKKGSILRLAQNQSKSALKKSINSTILTDKFDFKSILKLIKYKTLKLKDFLNSDDRIALNQILQSSTLYTDSIFNHTFRYKELNLKIKDSKNSATDTLSIKKIEVQRYSDDLSKSVFNWLTNLANTLSGLFLYLCYLALLLSTQERDDKKHIEISRSYKKGGIYIFVGLIFVDLLANIIDFNSAIDHKRLLQFLSYFSGLASSFTVFLLAGKLDSKLLKAGCSYVLIIFLYVYGAIQPLFFVFSDGSDEVIATLMGVALALKLSLFCLFNHLLKSNKLLFFVYKLRYLYNNQEKEFEKMTALKKQYKAENT